MQAVLVSRRPEFESEAGGRGVTEEIIFFCLNGTTLTAWKEILSAGSFHGPTQLVLESRLSLVDTVGLILVE